MKATATATSTAAATTTSTRPPTPVPAQAVGSPSLVIVGSVALDTVDGPSGNHPGLLGGSASYGTMAASFLLSRGVELVAVVGDDFPREHVDLLESHGIGLTGLEQVSGRTFRWAGRYSDDLNHRTTLETELGVFAGFRPRIADHARDAQFLFLGNIDPELQLEVLAQLRCPRLVACDTMNFWISGKPRELGQVLAKVHVLLVNDEEARQLSGISSLVKAAAEIRRMGPRCVIVKRGDAGALMFHEGETFVAPAYPVDGVRDPTGAGDTFAGAFMGYLARLGDTSPASIRRAMVCGSVLASFCVEDFSLDRMHRLTAEEFGARLDSFYALTHCERIRLG
ncbi:MAG: PfkB family carbohydrate kinase [Pseudomonadota bacterium]